MISGIQAEINQMLNPQKTPHTSTQRASYGVSFFEYFWANWPRYNGTTPYLHWDAPLVHFIDICQACALDKVRCLTAAIASKRSNHNRIKTWPLVYSLSSSLKFTRWVAVFTYLLTMLVFDNTRLLLGTSAYGKLNLPLWLVTPQAPFSRKFLPIIMWESFLITNNFLIIISGHFY